MKKIVSLLVFIFIGITALMAQSVETLSYQAVVRDNNNKLISNQTISIEITISVNSVTAYFETRNITTNKNGMVSFAIGDANRVTNIGEISDISDWKNASVSVVYHLSTLGDDVTTTDAITAIPYAFQADTASVVNPTYVNNVIADSIANPTSEINHAIDTMIQNAVSSGSVDCAFVMNCSGIQAIRDSIQDNRDTIRTIMTNLRDTINTSVLDSVSVGSQLADSIIALEKQYSKKFTATAAQTTFTLTIPSGYGSVNTTNRLVELYINGTFIGTNLDGVISVNSTTATYDSNENNDNELVAGDRVQIIYWLKK